MVRAVGMAVRPAGAIVLSGGVVVPKLGMKRQAGETSLHAGVR
jgi:hypothetical protein